MIHLKVFDYIPSENELSNTFQQFNNGFGYFYCIDCVDCIKIGSSRNISKRMIQLKKYLKNNGKTAVRLAVSEPHINYRDNEKKLHGFFEDKRVPKTEIFNVLFDDFILFSKNIDLKFVNQTIQLFDFQESDCEDCSENHLGERLKALRTSINKSQEYIAMCLEVSRVTVANWETGVNEPTAGNIKKLAKVFGVTTDELLGMEE